MHFTPTFLPVLIHALSLSHAGLSDLAIRAPTQNIKCAVTNQQGGTSIVHDEARTTKMVQWVLEDKDVMTTILGSTNTPQITYPNPYPYDIKKPQSALTRIYQSIAEVSRVRLSYLQIVGGLKSCQPSGSQSRPCHILIGEDARGDLLFGMINTTRGKGLSLQGPLALASFSRFSIKGTPKLIVAVNKVAKSSVRWLFEQPEMIAKLGSLVIGFLNDFPLPSIPLDESVHFEFYGAPGSPCPEEKPCFALVGINHGHADSVHYGAVWDYDYGSGVDQARKPSAKVQAHCNGAQGDTRAYKDQATLHGLQDQGSL
ncbi:hypothetical protein BT96DRAFT_943308 [Gymnopus androsaceus JB14]|uniref:Uncharacterized protein n=1 Tax=Gymnopus androsaceus JB14 TaxID=1447944 RepID=A0A6A4HA43_9AGAR|nr:hypothetical protein BT96DRAFT_943308 [Gymnopus androsaceus JB14]